MARKILVVDDDFSLARSIRKMLMAEGYEVLIAGNGLEGLKVMFSDKPDLVLLDIVMPEMDGWTACRRIREVSNVPIIILTATQTSEDDITRGIDYGADDYLIKPVGSKELAAKIRAVLRRAELPAMNESKARAAYSDNFLTVDTEERKVVVNGERLKLTPTEFSLLAYMVRNRGRVLTHEQLLREVWGWEYMDDVDYVRTYISYLRRKIEPDHREPTYIITEPGVGYYFKPRDS